MHGQYIVAVYPSRADAEKAFRSAIGSGIPSDNVQISRADKPVWEWLFSKRVSEKDKKHYRNHLPDGETALSVLLDGAWADKIDALEDILDSYDPLDVHLEEEEGEEVHAQGSGAEAAHAASHPSGGQAQAAGGTQQHAHSEQQPHQAQAAHQEHHEHRDEHGEQIIPLPEEELNVSAQTSDRVRRIRTYVVEEPVEKEVSLSDERTIVERRPATTNDSGEIAERVYEFHERHDEPLVEKTQRVGEELVVRKESTQHKERVHGTVRRTKAEIEKDMGAQLSPPRGR